MLKLKNICCIKNYGYYLTLLQTLFLILTISACGQSGPLYLPEESVNYTFNS